MFNLRIVGGGKRGTGGGAVAAEFVVLSDVGGDDDGGDDEKVPTLESSRGRDGALEGDGIAEIVSLSASNETAGGTN